MKNLIVLITINILIIFSGYSLSQPDSLKVSDPSLKYWAEQYKTIKYVQDYNKEFANEEDQRNFQKLRTYLNNKQVLKKSLMELVESIYTRPEYYLKKVKTDLEQLSNVVKGKSDKTLVSNIYVSTDNHYYNSDYEKITVQTIKERIIPELKNVLSYDSEASKIKSRLQENIALVDQDLKKCEDQINITLAPEYKQQDFRKSVSLNFTLLIAVLLIGFFLIIYMKSDNNLGKEFLSDHGLQFVTLFVLIIAIILFGILGILEGRELAAILSGISGYILGKGINSK